MHSEVQTSYVHIALQEARFRKQKALLQAAYSAAISDASSVVVVHNVTWGAFQHVYSIVRTISIPSSPPLPSSCHYHQLCAPDKISSLTIQMGLIFVAADRERIDSHTDALVIY